MVTRSRGKNAQLLLYPETTYGTSPGGNYAKLPFVSATLGETQNLIASDILGFGRDPQDPIQDVVNNDGNVTIPVTLRELGYWLEMLMGAATSDTQGVAATGSYTFSAQPVNNSVITIGGTAVTFVTAAPSGNQIQIGASLAATLANAEVFLNDSTDTNIKAATYQSDLANTKINITYGTIGTSGNSFTIVAGSSPATNATASGATLAGGSSSGSYNHVFTTAGTPKSASIELGLTDQAADGYGMNYGCMLNTMQVKMQRSGLLTAQLAIIAQGESRADSSAGGTPTTQTLERFTQFSGQLFVEGTPIGDLESADFTYSNGIDKIETIRSDGRINGADPDDIGLTGSAVMRFGDRTLWNAAKSNAPKMLRFGWSIATGKTLTVDVHRVFFPRVQIPIAGPQGIRTTFNWQAAKHATLGKTATITLTNDVASYP